MEEKSEKVTAKKAEEETENKGNRRQGRENLKGKKRVEK
jgi:hypothetical protein